jgi:hypothetical protein
MIATGRIVVGFVVSTLLLMLIAGGIEEAFLILLVSIVCTAGIGLVVWIPLWWAVGWLVLTLFSKIRGPGGTPASSDRAATAAIATPASSAELSLVQFLKQAEVRGVDRDKIDRALMNAGWSEEEILQARSKIASTSAGVWI